MKRRAKAKTKVRKRDKAKVARYRSAVTGRFVSAAFAKRHPRTTVRERKA